MFIVLLGHSMLRYLATQQPMTKTGVLCGKDSGEGLEAVLECVVLTWGMRIPCELSRRAGRCLDLARRS